MHRNKPPDEGMEDALRVFTDYLHKRSLRITDVREAIVRAALERSGHFQVEDLVEDIRKAGHEVSKATVYRAMPLLVESGIVQPTDVSADRRHFEATFGREHHDHLICSHCHGVVEFYFEAFEMLQREVAAKYDFVLTDHIHELIGVCGTCRRAQARSDAN
jgi:Fur family ferric uptake transcriptional regulator